MKDLSFGLITTLVGMGVTMLTLFLLTWLIRLLNWLFPAEAKEKRPAEVKTGKAEAEGA